MVNLDTSRQHVVTKTRRRNDTDGAATECRRRTTQTYAIRKSVNTVSDSKCDEKDASFAFKVTGDNFNSSRENSLLVDTGATAHILNDKSKFLKFDEFKPENHYIEYGNGSRASGVVSAKGRAQVTLHDVESNVHNVFLEDALYVTSYK